MNNDIATLAVSISSCLVSIAAFVIAYSQMKIASAKTRLDLYNKRFHVYVTALDYYQATWHESHNGIHEKGIEFTKSFRESKFLFDPGDGVYETLEKIQQNGAHIHAFEKHKYEMDNNLTKDDLYLKELHKVSVKASTEFAENLANLEKQIERYINFQTVAGWKFL